MITHRRNNTRAMALNVETLKSVLLRGQELSDNEIVELRDCMLKKTLKEMRVLSKSISVKLTGSSRKVDIVDRLISMAKIGAVQDVSADSEPDNNATGISYITDQIKAVLQRLPTFESVTEWKMEEGTERTFDGFHVHELARIWKG